MYEKRIESPSRYPEYRGLVCQRPKYHKQSMYREVSEVPQHCYGSIMGITNHLLPSHVTFLHLTLGYMLNFSKCNF